MDPSLHIGVIYLFEIFLVIMLGKNKSFAFLQQNSILEFCRMSL